METERMPSIYLASRYGRREEMLSNARLLVSLGYRVTSRWVEGGHEMKDEASSSEELRRFADEDLNDLREADILLAFTESPGDVPGRARGGRWVEFGFALATGKIVVVVGYRENVFCHLSHVGHLSFLSPIGLRALWQRHQALDKEKP